MAGGEPGGLGVEADPDLRMWTCEWSRYMRSAAPEISLVART